MALQLSVGVRNAMLDAIETTAGTSAILRWYSGSAPANCAAAATGTLLGQASLPSDYLAAASSGTKAKSGTWSGTGQSGAGTGTNAGYWRLWDSAGTTCHAQGTVTVTGGGGDMTLDNINIANNQTISVSSWTLTGPNA